MSLELAGRDVTDDDDVVGLCVEIEESALRTRDRRIGLNIEFIEIEALLGSQASRTRS